GIEGIAPNARLLPIAVPLTGAGPSALTAADALPQAIRWAADHGASIISMSLGGDRDPARDAVPCPVGHQDAITYAINKGAIVVAASGNGGESGSPVEEPGVCLGVVSVGAVDSARAVSSFSSRHPYLTVSAPGQRIATLSKVRGVAYVGEGTSQATALTSAALALVWSKFPTLSGREIVTKLLNTVDDLGPAGHDDEYGYGFIRPDLAIFAGIASNAPNPVYDGIAPYLPTDAPSESIAPAPPAATAPAPPGTVEIGAAPSDTPPLMVTGAAVAAVGVVMLWLLVVFGIRGRRRRRRREPPVTIFAPGRGFAPSEPYVIAPEAETATPPTPEESVSPPSSTTV
ncbi:MAG: apr, partial [Jatrophihabitantaceae bacterium]|nr:apr [Jatrophihabitantaceae bacterium]